MCEDRVDPARGSIPVEIRMAFGRDEPKTSLVILNDDLRKIRDDAWLPFRTLTFIAPSFAREFVIEEADCSKPPDPATFRLEFPEARPMIDVAAKVRHAPRKVWTLKDLDSDPEVKPIRFSKPGDSQPNATPTASSWGKFTLLNVCAIAFVIIYMTIRGRYHKAGPDEGTDRG